VEANPPVLPDSEGSDSSSEHRIAARANLMLAASIEGPGFNASVRIRNLSETGALLEGPDLPPVGSSFRLSRLKMHIAGTVVWLRAPRCGVRFEGPTSVSDWIAGNSTAGSKGAAGSVLARANAPLPGGDGANRPEGVQSPRAIDYRIARELSSLQELLKQAASELEGEPGARDRVGPVLEKLAAATEIAGQLALVLTSRDQLAAARGVTLQALRDRLAG
jgi:hypothetical protein